MPDPKTRKRRNPFGEVYPPDELRGIFGESYKWGFEPPEGIPEELMPQNVYDFWRKEAPYDLYLVQLKDFLTKMLTADTEDNLMVLGENWEQMGGKMSERRVEEAQNIYNRALAYMEFGVPVEALPLYEDVSQELGPNFQKLYSSHLQEEMEIMGVEKERQKLLGGSTALSAGGRQALADAVREGIISQEEAFGPGSRWEGWQHGEADEANRELRGNALPEESEGAALMRYAEASRQGQEQIRQRLNEGRFYQFMMPDIADMVFGKAGPLDLGGDMTEGQRYDTLQSLGLGNLMPGTRTSPGGGGGYVSPEDIRTTQFMGFMNTPEGKKAISDLETKMTQQYGDLYPLYKQDVLAGTGSGKSIEDWIQKTTIPGVKDRWAKISTQRVRSLGRRGETIL